MDLEKLLNFYDGKCYDQLETHTYDVPFYIEGGKAAGGPVLEIGCGTGRLTLPIAQAGVEIVGIDCAESMLVEARRKAAALRLSVSLHQMDARSFELGRKFTLIIIPYNALSHFYRLEDLESLFDCLRRHLEPSGRLVVDVLHWPLTTLCGQREGRRVKLAPYPNPYGEGTINPEFWWSYDPVAQVRSQRWYLSDEEGKELGFREAKFRVFFPQELDALLRHEGFALESRLGDYSGGAFSGTSQVQICVCTQK